MKPTKSWKGFELRVCRSLGGRRTGILGGEDMEHSYFSGEIKLLKSLPKWLTDIWGQAVRNCPDGKTPFACVKKSGRNDKNALIILSFQDFKKMLWKYTNVKNQEGGLKHGL